MGETLSSRALNRALLERQLLLRRASVPPLAAVEHLVGMQAQRTTSPYLALWSRLDRFRLDDLGRLLTERQAVRATMMRGTVHLVSAADAVSMRPAIQPVLERDLFPTGLFRGQKLDDLDISAVLAAGRELLESQPRSAAQLRELLAPQWPDRDPAALSHAIRLLLPVVHVPPRGVWGKAGRSRSRRWIPGSARNYLRRASPTP